MILTGLQILAAVRDGSIVIDPFRTKQVGPNSYDFRLGQRCLVYSEPILDPKKPNRTRTFLLPKEGLTLHPHRLYLVNTQETLGSTKYVPIIRGRSSVGRLGLFINITADLIDLGSVNQWTLQLHCVQPVKVFPGMLIGQVTFWRTFGRRVLYSGKYSRLQSPVSSLAHVDFL